MASIAERPNASNSSSVMSTAELSEVATDGLVRSDRKLEFRLCSVFGQNAGAVNKLVDLVVV